MISEQFRKWASRAEAQKKDREEALTVGNIHRKKLKIRVLQAWKELILREQFSKALERTASYISRKRLLKSTFKTLQFIAKLGKEHRRRKSISLCFHSQKLRFKALRILYAVTKEGLHEREMLKKGWSEEN